MTADRRTPEASPLRDLFQEQWSRLQDLLERREAQRMAEQEKEQALSSAVDNVVDHTDARIRAIGNYKRRLRENVHALVEHISELTERLPPALPVSRQGFLDNPMLNSMFVDPREMQLTFSRSHELQEFFAGDFAELGDMAQGCFLGFVEVFEYGAGRGDRAIRFFEAKTFQSDGAKLLFQRFNGSMRIEDPAGAPGYRDRK